MVTHEGAKMRIGRKVATLFNWISLGMIIWAIFGDLEWSTVGWSFLAMFIVSVVIGYIEGSMRGW